MIMLLREIPVIMVEGWNFSA